MHSIHNLDQVIVRAVILHLRNADAPNLSVPFAFGDFIGDKLSWIQRPSDADKRIIFRHAGALARQAAVDAVGETTLGIMLEQIHATAMRVAIHTSRLQPKRDGRGGADADVLGAYLVILVLQM